MRIGLIATEFPPAVGGMEQHALGLADALSKFDEVTVYTHRRFRGHPYQERFNVEPVLEGDVHVDIKALRGVRPDAWLCLNAGYAALSRRLPEPVFCYCHGNDFLNPWIRNTGPIVRRLTRQLKSVPLVWRLSDDLDSWASRYLIWKGLREANEIFVNSRFTKKKIQTIFPKLKKAVSVSHPGINEQFYEKPLEHGRNVTGNSELKIMTAARLSSYARKKNVEGLLYALSFIKDVKNFRCDIYGDGNLRKYLENLRDELGLESSVFFWGNVNRKKLISALDETHIFVLASKASEFDVESFGLVYVEAAARGVPVIISAAGGATDAVADGITGFVIENSEPDEIARGIREMWENYSDFDIDNIRAFAEKFRWEQIGSDMRNEIVRSMTKRETSSAELKCQEIGNGQS